MRDILIVMKFTIGEMIGRKSFIISTLIIMALIVGGMNVPKLIEALGEEEKSKLYIVDSENVFEGNLEILEQVENEDYDIEFSNDSIEVVKEKVDDEEIDSAIVVEKDDNDIRMRYIVKDMTMMSDVPEDIVVAMNSFYRNLQISKLDLSEEQLESITPNFEFSLEQTAEEEAHGNVLAMMLMSIVLFYAIYFCAYQVSSSITTEKTSKIMETLVTSTTPKTIVLGKTLGIGVVGLVQLFVLGGTAVISAKCFLNKELIESLFDLSYMNLTLVITIIVYFILGYLLFALLYALTGSTVSKPEDIQSANGPIAILAVVGFYLSYFTMINPTSELNKIAGVLPISSPFCMPFRVMMGIADMKEICISMIVLVVTIAIIAKVAIKIYSNAILNYGTKLSVKDILNMYKSK